MLWDSCAQGTEKFGEDLKTPKILNGKMVEGPVSEAL